VIEMARQITDAQRQVTVHFPEKRINWKRLMTWIVLACIVAGLSSGGYYVYNQVTSTAELPNPPVQPGMVTPTTPTETPTQTQPETPMPIIEVVWGEVKLPPLEYGYDDIEGFSVKDGGRIIEVYRLIGPAKGGEASLYSYWRTTDGGQNWEEIGEEILDEPLIPTSPESKLSKLLELDLMPRYQDRLPGYQYRYWQDEEIVTQQLNPLVEYGEPWVFARDQNNSSNIFLGFTFLPFDRSLQEYKEDWVYRLLLSTDGGKSWKQLNFPSSFAAFDAYPETSQLTLLETKEGYGPDIRWAEIISSNDDSIHLYLVPTLPNEKVVFWKATIKSPN